MTSRMIGLFNGTLSPKPTGINYRKARCVCIGLFFFWGDNKLWGEEERPRRACSGYSPFFKPFATIAPLAKAQGIL